MAAIAARRGIRTQNRIINAINKRDKLGEEIIKFIKNSLGLEFQKCHAEHGEMGKKADVKISCDDTLILISVKEFDVRADYNHIERNFVDIYAQRWKMPSDVYEALKLYVGEVDQNGNPISIENLEREAEHLNTSPGRLSKRRRKLLNQMDKQKIEAIKKFFKENKQKILKEAFLGEEDIKFFIIAKRDAGKVCYYILPAEKVLSVYESGGIEITRRGNLKVGEVTLQRKGGDHRTARGWRNRSASQLQFKIRPSLCIRDSQPVFCE